VVGSGALSTRHGKALGFSFLFTLHPACRYARAGLADGWWDYLPAPSGLKWVEAEFGSHGYGVRVAPRSCGTSLFPSRFVFFVFFVFFFFFFFFCAEFGHTATGVSFPFDFSMFFVLEGHVLVFFVRVCNTVPEALS